MGVNDIKEAGRSAADTVRKYIEDVAELRVETQTVTPGSDGVVLAASDQAPTRALLIAGRPLKEPIAQYGPFVMNTRAELMQAVEDFQSGKLA